MSRRWLRERLRDGVPTSLTCASCGRSYVPEREQLRAAFKRGRRFCSMACRNTHMRSGVRRGSAHPSWKGDAAKPRSIRSRACVRRRREAPSYCEACGFMLTREAHHKDGNPLNNELDNFAYLCIGCHDLAHKSETVWAPALAAA